MLTMKFRSNVRAITKLLFCLLLANTAQGQNHIIGCDAKVFASPAVSTDAEVSLLEALSALGDINERKNRIEKAAQELKGKPGSNHLLDKAIVVLAALHLQQQDYKAAQRLLLKLPQTSSSAVPAALLLAESWRLQGNIEKASDWFIRVGQRYPHNYQALAGLVSAADDLQQEQPSTSRVLYSLVIVRAQENAEKIEALAALRNRDGLRVLQQPIESIPSALQEQLALQIFYRRKDNIDSADRATRTAHKQYDCMLERTAAYTAQRAQILSHLQYAESQIDLLRKSINQHEREIDELKDKLIADDLSEQQLVIRKHITALSNVVRQQQGARLTLTENKEKLPKIIERLDVQMAALSNWHRSVIKNSEALIAPEFSNAAIALQNKFLNLAGDAAARIAELNVGR